MTKTDTKPALLTRTEIEWLRNTIQLSDGYKRKIKCDITRKLRIFNELELPLLVKSGFITATANCNNVTTNCNMTQGLSSLNPVIHEIQSQNMVGRKGCVTISVLIEGFLTCYTISQL